MVTYSNVWNALFDNKEQAENLRIRSELMIEITKYLNQSNLTQKQAAEKIGISQPRLSNLINGKIDKFTIDMLVNILSKTDHEVKLSVNRVAEVAEASFPWRNFQVLSGGSRGRRSGQEIKSNWDLEIYEPDAMQTCG